MNWKPLGWSLVVAGVVLLAYGMADRSRPDGTGELFVRFLLPLIIAAAGAGLIWPVKGQR